MFLVTSVTKIIHLKKFNVTSVYQIVHKTMFQITCVIYIVHNTTFKVASVEYNVFGYSVTQIVHQPMFQVTAFHKLFTSQCLRLQQFTYCSSDNVQVTAFYKVFTLTEYTIRILHKCNRTPCDIDNSQLLCGLGNTNKITKM